MNIFECRALRKAYKKGKYVLDNFNLSISGGKIVGLLGPNGCGKSTLMKLTAGLLTPDAGEIFISDEPIGEKSKALISYLPERTYFNQQQRIRELVDFFADFYPDFDKEKANALLDDLNIDKNARLKTLSKGTQEKVQLILVMSRRAKLYLLDEPIAGVDPAAREYILGTIVGNYSNDSTIIITTHLIADVEQVLDEYVFLSQDGKVLEMGTVDDVRGERGQSLNDRFKEVFRYATEIT